MAEKIQVGNEMVPSEISPVVMGPVRDIVPVKVAVAENSEVRSDAEVRHGIVHFLTKFSQLQLETNLNIPPSNWLRSSSKLEQHVQELAWQSTRRPSEFSSIDMAHNSPDLTGEVDVIAHAENIKKLLKMPFGRSHVSMMVHRVGKTLLLDEFDIHKHLLRQEQADWGWLRQFYYDSVLREKMKCVPRQRKSRGDLQNRNMYSKFLYHSLGLGHKPYLPPVELPVTSDSHIVPPQQDPTLLPDPLPQPVGTQHHREVLWTFEDIRMLIGTDLPIFSGDSYYVSLKLRDMRTPVNVLTGLDYWLDNLMCNVPEVAMCFQINGIVKKYEVLKTEDIPQLENSEFDPQVVTDIAKNILSFLKTNATKEGHTYWLYKGADDDFVKLYDLTALCGEDSASDAGENPFTVPVGMLLYRVARNMWTNHGRCKAPVIRTLLENCLFLLDEEKHSQVCTSANYLLSDMYVPDSSVQDDWTQPPSSSDNSDDEESCQEPTYEADDTSADLIPADLDVRTLSSRSPKNVTKDLVRVRPFTETVEERCLQALTCIHKGLVCLNHNMNAEARHKSSIVEEQARCNSDEPIPLHYEPIHKDSDDTHRSHLIQLTSMKHDTGGPSWHNLSKGLLLRKAAMTFSAMTKLFMTSNNYKSALRCLRASLCCYDGMKTLIPRKSKEYTDLLSSIFALGGDIRLVLTKSSLEDLDWDLIFLKASPEENAILDIVDTDQKDFDYHWVTEHGSCMERNLIASVDCYKEALKLVSCVNRDEKVSIAKRLGNIQNELGLWYMHEAQKFLQTEEMEDQPPQLLENLWRNSKENIQHGLQSFENIGDVANQILLHCNTGRLMRLCAQTYTHITLRSEKQEFSSMERYYFNKAIEEYRTSLSLCAGAEAYRSLQESVTWEITTTYYNMAILLQDYAPLSTMSQDEIEKEIVDLMNKSLKYCKMDCTSAKQPMYQYRAASINHRLASLFHNSLRNQCSDQRRRRLRQLAENHYARAVQQYQLMECCIEGLRVQLERFGLLEFCLTSQTNTGSRWRLLLQMLHLIIDTEELLGGLIKQLDDPEEQIKLQKDTETISNVMESRLQFTLLQLVLAFKANNKKAKKDSHLLEELKSLYARSLHQDIRGDTELNSLKGKCVFLQTCLREVSNFYHKIPDVQHDGQL